MMKNLIIFANQLWIGMETITLSFEPGSDFAVALENLIRNSEGVRVVRRKRTKAAKKQTVLDVAIQEEKEGKVQSFTNVDELFAELGI